MKKIILFVVILVSSYEINAQFLNKLSIDLNIARYSRENTLYNGDSYPNKMSYITGFNIGYKSSDKFRHYIGIRKIYLDDQLYTDCLCGPYELVEKKGIELNIGTKFSFRGNKRIFLGYGLEIFGEFSELLGLYHLPPENALVVDHRYNYIGIAPSLTLNIRIIDRLLFFVGNRYRLGKVYLTKKDSNNYRGNQYQNKTYWESTFDPINSIGIRFEL